MKRLIPIVALCCLVFSGCIEFGEDIWINPDGTGRIKFDVAVPEAFFSLGKSFNEKDSSEDSRQKSRLLEAKLKADPRVQQCTSIDTLIGEEHHYIFDVTAKKYADLPDLHSLFFSDSGMTDSHIERTHPAMAITPVGKNIRVSFAFNGDSTDTPAEPEDSVGAAIGNAVLGGKGFEVRLHAASVTSTNGVVDTAAKTVTWTLSLLSMNHPGKREWHAEIIMPTGPTPMTVGPVFWIVIALIIAVGIVVWRRRVSSPSTK